MSFSKEEKIRGYKGFLRSLSSEIDVKSHIEDFSYRDLLFRHGVPL